MLFSESLKKNHEFRRLYAKGRSRGEPTLVIYSRKTKRTTNRVGITVSNKVGNAVRRNRVRRRLKEIYRLNEAGLVRGVDMVIVARVRSKYAKYRDLERDFLRACGKLKLLQGKGTDGSGS